MLEFGGFIELLIIVFAALLLLGPKELPQLLRLLGKCVYKFRHMTGGLRAYIDHHMHAGEIEAFTEKSYEEARARSSEGDGHGL
jgi:sec-independent protein translocase protein TatB